MGKKQTPDLLNKIVQIVITFTFGDTKERGRKMQSQTAARGQIISISPLFLHCLICCHFSI